MSTPTMNRHAALCFIIMPFGEKRDVAGRLFNFDTIYSDLIHPAVLDAGMKPLRADEDFFSGIIHKAMFERLMLCDFALADLTTANANVFYELGIRHGIRPHSTLPIFAKGTAVPFDVTPVRRLQYSVDESVALDAVQTDRRAISAALADCREVREDSPLFQLVSHWPKPDIARLKTDKFHEQIEYHLETREALSQAKREGKDAVCAVADDIDLDKAEPAVAIAVMLAHRGTENWQGMVDDAARMPPYVSGSVLVREQLAFALNRLGRDQEAESLLVQLIEENGPSSETNGLLGRVHKDRFIKAREAGKNTLARVSLHGAIDTYLDGYRADMRDAYPGINAATLMEFDSQRTQEQADLLPCVLFAANLRAQTSAADYWDFATIFELRVLQRRTDEAMTALMEAAKRVREPWELKTTLKNLTLIRAAAEESGKGTSEIDEAVQILTDLVEEHSP